MGTKPYCSYFCTENKSGHWKNHEKMEAEGKKGDSFAVFYEVKVKSLQNEKQILYNVNIMLIRKYNCMEGESNGVCTKKYQFQKFLA